MTFDDLNMVTDMSKRSEQANHVVIDMTIVPELPKVLSTQEIVVYVPKASHTHAGIIKPSDTDFVFVDGYLRLKNKNFSNIDSISVNGINVEPDTNKNVDIKVPTKTSDLLNDSDFATTNDIPTKVSDFENDSKFVNEETLESVKKELKDYADENEKVGDINVIEGIKVNGTSLTPNEQKEVDIKVPTNTSDLINDRGFLTEDNLPEHVSGISEYVRTTKTINSLTVGDTLFKGDTIEINIDKTQLLTYFLNEPIWTNIYLVNKETNNGFRFACYVKHIYTTNFPNTTYPKEKKFVIDIQVHYVEGDTKQFILEKSIPIIIPYTYALLGSVPNVSKIVSINSEGKEIPIAEIETTYSFINTIKDISNLYIHYANSLKENNVGEGFIGGITAEGGEVQDTLVNRKDGIDTSIDNYVKVKDDKFVKVVNNVEKLLPINEETDKKLDELEDKINGSHIVNISKFALNSNTNTWFTDDEIKPIVPTTGNGTTYIVKTNDGLYYYSYIGISENVNFIKGNSGFYETTITSTGKKVYTSNTVSTIREGTPARVDKGIKGLSFVSFDLYMSGLGGSNIYYPEIAFVVNEAKRVAIEVAFSCYNGFFQLKINRKDKSQIIVGDLPYSNGVFNAKIEITIQNNTLIVYINNEVFSRTSLSEICPELVDFSDLENIYFGLRYDKTPPTDWGFSNVKFSKRYWEKGHKIQSHTLYVNLEDNSLYRYTNDTTTKPYPNFVEIVGGSNVDISVPTKISDLTDDIGYVRWGDGENKRITKDTIINTGDVVCINVDVNKLFSSDSLFQEHGALLLTAHDENTDTAVDFFITVDQIDGLPVMRWGYITEDTNGTNIVDDYHIASSISDVRSFYAITYNGASVKVYEEFDEFPLETDYYYWTIGAKGFYQVIDGKINHITTGTGADKEYIDQKVGELSSSINQNTQEIARVSNAVKDLPTKNEVEELFNNLSDVAKTGKYVDLLDPPYIPTKTSDLTNNGSDGVNKFATVNQIPNVPTLQTNKPTYDYSDIQGTENVADKKYVDDAISGLVGSAPDKLNTLEELAGALKNSPGIVDALNEVIGSKAAQADVDAINTTITNFENGSKSVKSADTAEVANAIKVANGTSTAYTFKIVSNNINDPGEEGSITFIIG